MDIPKENCVSYSFYADSNHNLEDSLTESLEDSFSSIPKNITTCKSPPDPINVLSKRVREKWVEDSASTKCKSCNATFRIYRRVHHCRGCGLAFCDNCSRYRMRIPTVIRKIPTRSGSEEPIDYNTPVRLCSKCYEHFQRIHKLEKLLTVFTLLNLDLNDFKNVSLVCKSWRYMALTYLSKFRQIQYKLPKYSYSNWEKQALWTNRYILKNHSIWEIHVLRSLKLTEEKEEEKFQEAVQLYFNGEKVEKNNKECWDRMCNRYCKTELDAEQALLLFDLLEGEDIISKSIVKAFDKCDDYVLEKCYLPYILFKMVEYKNTIIKDFVFSRCLKSIRIASVTYWFLKNNCKSYFSELFSTLSQEDLRKLIKSEHFTELCKEGDGFYDTIVSPVTPELGEQDVISEGITIKRSATKPTIIPLDKSVVMFKKDDIRRDYIIMCVIRLMERLLQENGLDVSLITYNVQPTSKNEGFIQIVEDCETLYSISENLNTTCINFLLQNNPNESVSNLRNRFKTSCAIYSVIAFLLSISDRNTENLMLTKKGDFFLIDFGFILSLDPKVLRTPCIRITDQMLEALGGSESKEYEEFKELCGIVYDILRKHVNTFVCLLSMIPTFKSNSRTSPDLDENEMYAEIIKRFCPGETYEDAIKNIKTRIDNSTNHSTFSKYHVIDFFHKINKEQTLTNIFGGTLSTAYYGTKSLMGGIYSYMFSFS